ncbi:MAG: 50S ribosomal protein L6 [Vallitaleaceae bacterium]|jgi:large subunit ribosomal protein L6|nr:50S ribosomal protein L6 [Vallitaleaceae bacterium]
MSRIGRLPVVIPAGVEVKVTEDNYITVKGPKGTLERLLVPQMSVKVEGAEVVVTRPNDLKKMKSFHGLTRTLIANMVEGVTNGFEKKLEIQGVGYRAAKNGKNLDLSLGYSHPVNMVDPEGVESVVEGNIIKISGINKEDVGQYAAEIRAKRKPEPYKGKGIRYVGEIVRRKEGKTGK